MSRWNFLFTSTLDLELRKKLVKCCVWSIALYGAETWTLRAIDQKHLKSFEMWCWRRMEKSVGLIMWEIKMHYLESRSRGISYMKYVNGRRTGLVTFCDETAFYNGLLKERYKGGIEVTGRQGRRRRKLLDDLKERRGYSHLKEEALDRTIWRARFGRGFGPVIRQTAKWMNEKCFRQKL